MGTKTIGILALAVVAVGCGDRTPDEGASAPQRVATREQAPAPSHSSATTPDASTSSRDPETGTSNPDAPAGQEPSTTPPVDPATVPNSLPNTDEATSPGQSPSTPSLSAPVSSLTDRYVIKTRNAGPGEMPEFRVTINGTDVAYSGDGSTDITSMFEPGKNQIQLAWTPSQASKKDRFYYTELTLGLQRNGRWSTIVKKQLPQTTEKSGKTTYTVMAR